MTDARPVPRLSPSTANIIINESPLHAWQDHYLLGGGREHDETEAQARGKILDRLIFGVGPELAILDFDSYRTNAAKEARDAATEKRQIPVLKVKIGGFQEAAEIIREKMADQGVKLTGVSQARLEWTSDGCECKGRPNHFIAADAMIWDLKTCRSAAPDAVWASLNKYGAYVQHAAYVEGTEAAFPSLVGRLKMGFVFAEYVKPYAVTVAFLDGTLRQLGELRWKQAKAAWRRGIETGVWPGYSNGPITIEAKPWQMDDAIKGGSSDVTF